MPRSVVGKEGTEDARIRGAKVVELRRGWERLAAFFSFCGMGEPSDWLWLGLSVPFEDGPSLAFFFSGWLGPALVPLFSPRRSLAKC